jgi:hypothetical protein
VLVGVGGRLLVDDRHGIGMENIRFPREHYGYGVDSVAKANFLKVAKRDGGSA